MQRRRHAPAHTAPARRSDPSESNRTTRAGPDDPDRGKGIAGSRPSGRSLFDNAIVPRVARLGSGAPLSLGASTSDELLGAAEIRTSVPADIQRPSRWEDLLVEGERDDYIGFPT
jgi:hypothetical protein